MARILLVEDDDEARQALKRILEAAGHLVNDVGDGRVALRRFVGDPPDLVITDMYMPEMDGMDLLIRLREVFPEAKVVCISGGGYAETEDVLKEFRRLGAAAVLKKPIDRVELIKAVESSLG